MRTVLITGITKGIGKALADKFLKEGYFVVGTILSGAVLQDKNLAVLQLDLSDPKSISVCCKEISKFGKKIDILINNAGILADEDDTKVILSKLRKTLEVNLIGAIDFTEQILPLVKKGGHIINISSSAGSLSGAIKSHFPNHYPSYKISKAALNMYTRTLASRLKGSEITVSSVHPGWTQTDMGGQEAEMSPEEAALGIYNTAISKPTTGQFWFKSKRIAW